VGRQAGLDGKPAGGRGVLGDALDASPLRRAVGGSWLGGLVEGAWCAGPGGRVGDDEAAGVGAAGVDAAVAGGAEDAAAVVAAAVGRRVATDLLGGAGGDTRSALPDVLSFRSGPIQARPGNIAGSCT
jgi:hypothetical protein